MKAVALHAFPKSQAQAAAVAGLLGLQADIVRTHRFPDGEILPRTPEAGATTIIVQSLYQPNEKLIELLLTADALRNGGARRLVLVAPYIAYMRQDIAFHPGEPISQRVIGDLLARVFDRIITVDAHMHRTPDLGQVFQGIESDDLRAADIIGPYLRDEGVTPDTLVLGPDSESLNWAQAIAAHTGLEAGALRKVRHGDHDVHIEIPDGLNVTRRPIILIDDICSTGGTFRAAAEQLRQARAGPVEIIVTHALFNQQAEDMLHASGVDRLRSADTIPHSSNAFALAPLFAQALQRELTP